MILRITLTVILLGLLSCTSRVTDPESNPPKSTNNQYFEIATWNIEWFPKNGNTTINQVKEIIRNIEIDLIAVQEIASIQSFNTLLDSLEGWNGVLSADQYSSGNYQKTGLLYKSGFISVSNVKNIFLNDSYAFPRPPLLANIKINDLEGIKYDFNIIVLHLKAFSGEDNEDRRRQAILKLENFVATEISNNEEKDFIILGDWNDALDDRTEDNVFTPFLEAPASYQFLSSFNIDHIMISSDSFSEYGAGETNVLNLESQYPNYSSVVSDHLPVVSRFAGFTLSLP